jgi:Zn-dependent protease with chaperone function
MPRTTLRIAIALACLVGVLSLLPGCAVETSSGGASTPSPSGSPAAGAPSQKTAPLDAAQADRIRRVMVPLIGVMDHPRPLNKVKVAVVDDPQINAASAGGGEFYVTLGLLQKANDQQLMAVLAHEVAHDDLGHVAKAQALGAGVGIGAVILDQIFPGTGQLAPVAGALITRSYSRKEEYAADKHGVELLKRGDQPKEVMIQTLTWLMQTEGTGGGGFFATHPATGDRIEALRKL